MNEPIPWLNEYHALTTRVGFTDFTGRSRVEIRGADRVRFLHSFCTGDIQRLTPGTGCEAFVTNHQGKTVGHVWVFSYEDRLELDAVAGQAAALIAHLDRFVISDDATFRDATGDAGMLLVAGPTAGEVLEQLTGANAPAQMWQHRTAMIGGMDVQTRRVDMLLPASFEIVCSGDRVDPVAAGLIAAGAVRCGTDAIEAARLESGIPLFGRDITPDNLPQEIRRDAPAISFTKGCYLGQETVARIDAMGHVNRLLAGVHFTGPDTPAPAAGDELKSGGKVVGQVTSSAWSPRLSGPLALALLRRPQAAIGTPLDATAGPAQVVALPLTG